ncbi:MAG: hypothetical protein GEV09_24015 [Pseudonocardiaceae bacterium]|nr:hypothetical protein [Pseudonocardiaceae bacterium]
MSKREQRQIDQAVDAVAQVLRQAVQDTITMGGPEPARETINEIAEIDDRSPRSDGGGAARMMAVYMLLGWLTMVRDALDDQPQRVDEILGWIEETLGRRYRARARYTSGSLHSDTGVDEITNYMDALRADFLPSLIWLLAGAVARYGAGDTEWLRRLERAAGGRSAPSHGAATVTDD